MNSSATTSFCRMVHAARREACGDAPLLSVVVPVYNEAETLVRVLDRVLAEQTGKEILIVDDGSTDGTADALDGWLRQPGGRPLPDYVQAVSLLRHAANQGKGMAIRSALAIAAGEYVVVQDADLEVSPEEYSRLLRPLLEGRAEIVVGARIDPPGRRRGLHRLGVAALNLLVRLLYGTRLADEACCFKLLRTADLRAMRLECRGFEFCPEVVAKASRLGLRFAEVPIAYSPRGVSAGKKLRLCDGLQACLTLWKHRRWLPPR